MVSLQNTEFTTEPEGAGCVCVPAHPSTAFRNYANAWAEAIPLLAEEGWREAPGWSVRPKPFANLTTPSAPIKEASRYFLKVASTPPLRGGEYERSYFVAGSLSLQSSTIQIESTVRFAGGKGRPRSAINFRKRAAVSGRATADCTPVRTRPSA